MIFVLVVACMCEAVALALFVALWRDEQDERRFWYESSERAWGALFGAAGISADDGEKP